MKVKQIVMMAYVAIGILYGLYNAIWGIYQYKGFIYNMGRGLMWPFIMFPVLGQLLALAIILAMLAGLTLFGKKE